MVGRDDLDFHGDTIRLNPDRILWNILGENRTINIRTAVYGAILSPYNILNQETGVIRGKVIVADVVSSLQINKPECVDSTTQTTTTTTGGGSPLTTGDGSNGTQLKSTFSSLTILSFFLFIFL